MTEEEFRETLQKVFDQLPESLNRNDSANIIYQVFGYGFGLSTEEFSILLQASLICAIVNEGTPREARRKMQ